MKNILLVSIMLLTGNSFLGAQTKAIRMGGSSIEVRGDRVSDIKLIDGAGKPIGNLYTHTSVKATEIIFTQYQNYKIDGIDFICIQKIDLKDVKNLIAEVKESKEFIDNERKTSPKLFWNVSISFKKKNGEYVEAGTTVEYRLSYESAKPEPVKEIYAGTNRLLPFATKAAAEVFAAEVKKMLKAK